MWAPLLPQDPGACLTHLADVYVTAPSHVRPDRTQANELWMHEMVKLPGSRALKESAELGTRINENRTVWIF